MTPEACGSAPTVSCWRSNRTARLSIPAALRSSIQELTHRFRLTLADLNFRALLVFHRQ